MFPSLLSHSLIRFHQYLGCSLAIRIFYLHLEAMSPFLLLMMAAALGKAVVMPYAYVGCWSEPSNARALATVSYASDAMTLEYCASLCAGVYQYWGVEYGREVSIPVPGGLD